jgi:limonene-1,2-epoxide hydrolase
MTKPQPKVPDPEISLGTRMKAAFTALDEVGLEALPGVQALYDEQLVFSDPIQTLHGRDKFIDLMSRMHTGKAKVHFSIGDICESDQMLFSTWAVHVEMRFTRDIKFEGVSHCHIERGVITRHRDYWDVAGVLIGQIPLIRPLYRRLTRFLS